MEMNETKLETLLHCDYTPTGMSYVVPLFDKLHKSYVQEKFDPQNRFSDVALDAVTVAINTVIGIDDE